MIMYAGTDCSVIDCVMALIKPHPSLPWCNDNKIRLRTELNTLDNTGFLYRQLVRFLSVSYMQNLIISARETVLTEGMMGVIGNPSLKDRKHLYTLLSLRDKDELHAKAFQGKLEYPVFVYYAVEDIRWLISGYKEYIYMLSFMNFKTMPCLERNI